MTHRKPGWALLIFVFVVLPVAAVIGGQWTLFHVFGNGSVIAIGSPGTDILVWWDGYGREITVGLVAFALLLVRRVAVARAALLSVGVGVATFGWLFVLLLVVLAFNPGALS